LWALGSDGKSGSVASTLEHGSYIPGLAYTPGKNALVSGSADKSLKLWNLGADGKSALLAATLSGHSKAIFAVAYLSGMGGLATGSDDQTARLWAD